MFWLCLSSSPSFFSITLTSSLFFSIFSFLASSLRLFVVFHLYNQVKSISSPSTACLLSLVTSNRTFFSITEESDSMHTEFAHNFLELTWVNKPQPNKRTKYTHAQRQKRQNENCLELIVRRAHSFGCRIHNTATHNKEFLLPFLNLFHLSLTQHTTHNARWSLTVWRIITLAVRWVNWQTALCVPLCRSFALIRLSFVVHDLAVLMIQCVPIAQSG